MRRQGSARSVLRRAATASVVVLAMAGLVTGCDSDEPPAVATTPTAPSTSGSASPTVSGSAQALEPVDPAQYLLDPADVHALATASRPSRSEKGATVTADVVSVTVHGDATRLVFRMSSTGKDDIDAGPGYDEVQIIDPAAKTVWLPYQFAPSKNAQSSLPACLCPQYANPLTTTPIQLNAVYPPLPASSSQVQVRIPGFKPMTVPVTRT